MTLSNAPQDSITFRYGARVPFREALLSVRGFSSSVVFRLSQSVSLDGACEHLLFLYIRGIVENKLLSLLPYRIFSFFFRRYRTHHYIQHASGPPARGVGIAILKHRLPNVRTPSHIATNLTPVANIRSYSALEFTTYIIYNYFVIAHHAFESQELRSRGSH